MPQIQPSGRGLLPSPTAWSPDQHLAAMLADVSWYIWAGLKDVVWGLISLSALTQGGVWNANPLQMGTQTTVPCAQAEDSGLLDPLQSPNWVKVCLVSTVFFLPVSIVLRVEKCLGLSIGDRVLCLQSGGLSSHLFFFFFFSFLTFCLLAVFLTEWIFHRQCDKKKCLPSTSSSDD